MKILGKDPGETTGYVLFNTATYELIEWGTYPRWSRARELIQQADLVICEDFLLFPHKAISQIGSRLVPVGVKFVIEYLCEELGVPIEYSLPSNQQFFTDSKLKRMDLYLPNRHVRSAWKHVLCHLRVNNDEWIDTRIRMLIQ